MGVGAAPSLLNCARTVLSHSLGTCTGEKCHPTEKAFRLKTEITCQTVHCPSSTPKPRADRPSGAIFGGSQTASRQNSPPGYRRGVAMDLRSLCRHSLVPMMQATTDRKGYQLARFDHVLGVLTGHGGIPAQALMRPLDMIILLNELPQ